ncbi:hypothetical protein GIB67_013188 [Kingdonia uniflora]|uniref:Uncharacterized protein n=1 Tax=Kingdonia uniflora TaxID=39325 RepID=A0A7J7LCY6_9MAGN|nr:hypothetical protein GIB67_013188 [Kingdonia uniflora]
MVVAEVAKTDIVFFNQEKVVDEAYQLVLMELEVDVTLKKRYILTDEDNNERAFKMACQMNLLHAHLDELLSGVLLESFIQRPISLDEKNHVDQVWLLRKDELSPEIIKDNRSTYRRIGEETVCLNTLYTLHPKEWSDNEVIDVYIKALIQYFDTQHLAREAKEKIALADIFSCQYIGRAFNVWTRNMSSPASVELKKKLIWEQITSMKYDLSFVNSFQVPKKNVTLHSTRVSHVSSNTPYDSFESVGMQEDQRDQRLYKLNRLCLIEKDISGEKAQMLKEHYKDFREKLRVFDYIQDELYQVIDKRDQRFKEFKFHMRFLEDQLCAVKLDRDEHKKLWEESSYKIWCLQ